VVSAMALLWFHAITLIPLAEAVALSFFAPLVALWLARALLGEPVGARAAAGSLIGLAGVAAIAAGRLGAPHGSAAAQGVIEVIASAVLYAVNLVLQRWQAQQAEPREIAFFQTLTVLACLLPAAPWAGLPSAREWPLVAAGAACASTSLLLLSWGYARAPAARLLPTEYTAFVWLALFGWFFFGEALTAATVAGAALIVTGCVIAVRPSAPVAGPPVEALL
jgi:S-adenosylmethionine uptake transporter